MSREAQKRSQPLVRLQDVLLKFGENTIFENLQFACYSGRHVAVTGENGAGKSALLRLCTGELWPARGVGTREFSFDNVTTDSPILARPFIRRVSPEMQERFLRMGYTFNVADVLLSGLDNSDYAAVEYSGEAQARMRDVAARFVLEKYLKTEARTLSHGTLRRLFIARAIMAKPRLLALDEAMDGLDAEYESLVCEALSEAVSDGATLLCVTHRGAALPNEIERVVEIAGGIVRDITLDDVRRPVTAPGAAFAGGTEAAADNILSLEDVSVRYGDVRALDQITWQIRRGEHWLVAGANGSGKSTLAEVLAGITPAAAGNVRRLDRSGHMNLWDMKREFVLISDREQTRYDWPLPVRDVVASGFFSAIGVIGELSEAQWNTVDALLERFCLTGLAVQGLDQLSFGQRRRVLIARAMVRRLALLILDECFDGLDRRQRALLTGQLRLVADAGTSLVVIAHDPRDVPAFVTHRLTLHLGKIVPGASDPPRSTAPF